MLSFLHLLLYLEALSRLITHSDSYKKEDDTRARFEGREGELVSADAPDLWKCFKEGMLKACDEVCGKKKGSRDQGDTWWWNEYVKEAIARKKDAHKEMSIAGLPPALNSLVPIYTPGRREAPRE